MGHVHPLGSLGTCVIDMIVMRETVETRRICHKIFMICNLLCFCYCWIDWKNWKKNWTAVPLLCSVLYCTAILEEDLEEEGNGKGREKKTDSQPNPEPSLGESEILRSFWMEGVVASYAIPATLLSPVRFALLCFALNNE